MIKKIVIIIMLLLITVSFGFSPSFNSGELSPLIKYRLDLDKRWMGIETMENFLVKPQGMAVRRPGTIFVAEANGVSELIPFEFSTTDSYVLEFGDSYIRFYRDE